MLIKKNIMFFGANAGILRAIGEKYSLFLWDDGRITERSVPERSEG
jgi:hypothetical protein